MSGVVTAFCYSVDHLRQVLKARNTHTPRFQSRVRCDGVHGEHETPVRDLWRPIQRETLRRFRLRGLQGFLQAEKTVKKMIEDCLMLTKKIVLIIFSGGRSERVLVTSISAKGAVSVR